MKTLKKISDILLTVFAVGILACLLAGGIMLVGYLVALCIGGETATAICTFLFKTYLPWVIKFTSIFTGCGLIGMYLSKQKALTASSDAAQESDKDVAVAGK